MSYSEKEIAIQELWKRLSSVTGISRAPMRNPATPPKEGDYPTINFFDMAAKVEDVRNSGKTKPPIYLWNSAVVIEPFVMASTEDASTQEINLFIKEVKRRIYQDGTTLGGTCASFTETQYTQYLKPPSSRLLIGISLYFNLRYIEDTGKIFNQ